MARLAVICDKNVKDSRLTAEDRNSTLTKNRPSSKKVDSNTDLNSMVYTEKKEEKNSNN